MAPSLGKSRLEFTCGGALLSFTDPTSRASSLKTYSKRRIPSIEDSARKKDHTQELLAASTLPQLDLRPQNNPPPFKDHPDEPSSKKRRVEEPQSATASLPIDPHPPITKTKRGTIQSYFKPLQSISICAKLPDALEHAPLHTPQQKSAQSADRLAQPHIDGSSQSRYTSDSTSTPPFSLPPKSEHPFEYPRTFKKKSKRRLTTRPVLAPLVNMSSPGSSFFDSSSDSLPEHTGELGLDNTKPTECHGQLVPRSSTIPSLSRKNLQQRVLDMGGEASNFTTCKDCDMYYNTTLTTEKQTHDAYHKSFIGAKQPKSVPEGVNLMEKYEDDGHHIIRMIDYRAPTALKKCAEKALQITLPELPGSIFGRGREDALWSLITNPHDKDDPNPVPRYKILLYLFNFQAVGVVLVERIARAGQYMYRHATLPVLTQPGQIIYLKDEEWIDMHVIYKCYMSVDRIWVREDMRRKQIATQLVDYAREAFVPGLSLSKKEIAFSRPTTVGGAFAKKYCDGLILHDFDSGVRMLGRNPVRTPSLAPRG